MHGPGEPPISILVVTGASGAGKTTAVELLAARELEGVRCFHFDAIGVPTAESMERDFGGGEQWQVWATNQWLARLGKLRDGVRVAVLDGQTRPSTVFAAHDVDFAWRAHVVLFDCSPEVRAERLREGRRQPELISARMDTWAAYLRGQADALGLPVIDTSRLSAAEAVAHLEAIVHRLAYSDEPTA